jgi:hypothetical protein
LPSRRLAVIRARWAEASVAFDKSELTRACQDLRELVGMLECAEDLLDTLYDRDQASSSHHTPVGSVGRDVWVDDITTARSALEETRTALATALDWSPP